MKVKLSTTELKVNVRGPQEMIDMMKETDISVTVDFSGAQIGAAEINGIVTVNTMFVGVGAVGVYPITATVSQR